MICGNRVQFLNLVAAIGWIGAVSVPINTASCGMPLQHILQDSGVRVLIVARALSGSCPPSTAARCRWKPSMSWTRPMARVPWRAGARRGSPPDPPHAGVEGLSRGVICPHGQFFWWAITTARQLGVAEGDVPHMTLPLFHTNAPNCFF